jgi:hypothetical protein
MRSIKEPIHLRVENAETRLFHFDGAASPAVLFLCLRMVLKLRMAKLI